MTTFTIGNDYISQTLGNNESYTPAPGEVQKLVINTGQLTKIKINGEFIKNSNSGGDNLNSIPIILDDTQTITADNTQGYHVSGFVIN